VRAPVAAAAGAVATAMDAVVRQLNRTPAGRQLATVSTVIPAPGGVHHGYQETQHIARTMTALCSDEINVLSATALGVGRLVLDTPDRLALERYTTAEISALTGPDPDGRLADLLTTLYTFLHASRSPRLAGERMNVHENTVRYRLRRVTELTGLDVAANSQDQLTAQVALLVLRLQGRLPGFDVLGNPTGPASRGATRS
jgi:hypothetical protein